MEGIDARCGFIDGRTQFRTDRIERGATFRLVHFERIQAHAVVVFGQHAQGDIATRGDIGHHLLDPSAHPGGQRAGRAGQQLRLRGLIQCIPVDMRHQRRRHASILSTGSTISPRAPARFNSSSRCQLTTPWQSACIASRSPPSTE